MVSSSCFALVSLKPILMKIHNRSTSTISVISSNWKGKHSQASISLLSCSSTYIAIPSHCLVEALWGSSTSSWPSPSMFYCQSFQKGYLLFRERLPSKYRHLRMAHCVHQGCDRRDRKQWLRPYPGFWGLVKAGVLPGA